ncbi:MAG TPA: hypothetical protein VL727_06575 [Puia sp.]|nr:hypothetical protein [Puia sp.]
MKSSIRKKERYKPANLVRLLINKAEINISPNGMTQTIKREILAIKGD